MSKHQSARRKAGLRALPCFAFAALCGLAAPSPSLAQGREPLTLDHLFGLSQLSHASVSPDGEWIAATVMRPVRPGEVYGRTFYEMDITRADVWLVSRRTGERRNLTGGEANASGYWCATWSPDGSRLAMLSTHAESGEPRGGDNARLYVWDRATDGIRRMSPRGAMSQTMGGSPLYKVDIRGARGAALRTAQCSERENAPFVWLDENALLAMLLPEGEASAIVDAYSRALLHAGRTRTALRDGDEVTVSAMDSGGAMPEPMHASLQRIDVVRAEAVEVAQVPIHPLDADLQVRISPDGRSAALLAGLGAIPHADGQRFAYPYSSWAVDKKLGFVALAPGAAIRWVESMPAQGRYILDSSVWSPDGSRIAVRARPDVSARAQGLFIVTARDLSVKQASPDGTSVLASSAGADIPDDGTMRWTPDGRLLLRAVPAEQELDPNEWYRSRSRQEGLPRVDWWLMGGDVAPVNLTAGMKASPRDVRPASAGRYVAIVDRALWTVDAQGTARPVASAALPEGASVLWSHPDPRDGARTELLVAGKKQAEGAPPLVRVVLDEGRAIVVPLPAPSLTSEFAAYEPAHRLLLYQDRAFDGSHLWVSDADGRGLRKLLSLNPQLARVAWGERRLIEYRGIDGQPLKGAVILPPDYRPGKRYPVVVWVYAGAMTRYRDDLSLQPQTPGQYNLQLYAARGYVVLMPSMPLQSNGGGRKNDDYIDLPKGAMPAVERLIELDIADPDRLAVMGQSYGGYSTYSLVTYTDRFKAAIAMAGLTDLVSLYGQLDPTARGHGAIEHQKSANWGLSEGGQVSMGVPPYEDLWRYLRNSPLYYVDRVKTPLLLIHGEQDIRGPMTQAEEFFFSLYRQGKRARLLRYWGEDHGLRLSPANIRDMVEEIFAWLEAHMPERTASAGKEAPR